MKMPPCRPAASTHQRVAFSRGDVWFALLSALGIVLLKLFLFDYFEYFKLQGIPNHDMYQASALFASSMHAMRLEGDIAWWLPTGDTGGYAQYFNHFLSPLAPTAGNLVFLLWSGLIWLLNLVHVAIPEYRQYLIVTFIILPLLANAALAFFGLLLFRRKIAVALLLVVYAFSSIGIWNASWYYYQEAGTCFFLLTAVLLFLRRPSLKRLLLLTAAGIIQLASLNYWTIYNAWFLGAMLIGYGIFFRPQLIRSYRWSRAALKRARPIAAVPALLVLITAVLWIVLFSRIMLEQAQNYSRDGLTTQQYTMDDAYARANQSEIRRFTTELFDPLIERPMTNFYIINEVHNARYIGAFLLPLLVLFVFQVWQRTDRWLVTGLVLMLSVAMTSGFLMRLWSVTPFMPQIRHFFYFYQHYVQILLVFIAVRTLDKMLCLGASAFAAKQAQKANLAIGGLAFATLAATFVFAERFPAYDLSLTSIDTAAVLIALSVVLVHQMLRNGRRQLMLCASLLLIVSLGDLSRYYWRTEKLDQQYTHKLRYKAPVPYPMPDNAREVYKKQWEAADPAPDFGGGVAANLPFASDFWPTNLFNPHAGVKRFQALPEAQRKALALPEPVAFVPQLEQDGEDKLAKAAAADTRSTARFTGWSYNHMNLSLHADSDSWAVLALLNDSNWRVLLDGKRVEPQRVNYYLTGIKLSAGEHQLELTYNPVARRLYPWARWSLYLALLALGLSLLQVVKSPALEQRLSLR